MGGIRYTIGEPGRAPARTGISLGDSLAGLQGLRASEVAHFAPGATGNVATEDLVYTFGGMGVETGVDLDAMLRAADAAKRLLGGVDRRTYSQCAYGNGGINRPLSFTSAISEGIDQQ